MKNILLISFALVFVGGCDKSSNPVADDISCTSGGCSATGCASDCACGCEGGDNCTCSTSCACASTCTSGGCSATGCASDCACGCEGAGGDNCTCSTSCACASTCTAGGCSATGCASDCACGCEGAGGDNCTCSIICTCANDDDDSSTANAISIANMAFSPSPLTISIGETVTWTLTNGTHTVVSDDGSWQSGSLSTGGTFTHQFDTAGEFSYKCGIHSSMTGTIIVQ